MKRVTWKKLLAGLLVAALLPLGALAALVAERAADQYRVSVTTGADSVTIGNGYLSRTFSTAEGKLTTANITNRRTDGAPTVFTPGEGSEEFKLRVVNKVPALDRTGWTAVTDSFHNPTGAGDGNAPNLIDGNTSSIWHTKYGSVTGNEDCREAFPYSVAVDLGKSTTFQCFSWMPRQDNTNTNASVKDYDFYYSTSTTPLGIGDEGWTLLKSGTFANSTDATKKDVNYVGLDAPCTATQVKLVAKNAVNGGNYTSGAEFNLHAEKDPTAGLTGSREFSAGELTLAGAPTVENTNATINGAAKAGQKLTFRFAPFTFRNVEYTITENVVMYDGDHFMRKYLEISVPEAQKANAVIDYIDLESLVTSADDATWTIPTDAGGIVQMGQFKANLGQPIYIQGMFFGCEFPVADNEIVDNVGYLRYYTGKSFTRLEADNQLTTDGKYVTWQTVAGAARSTDNAVIQADFFEYIKSIATPSDFRIQYNSWFDNMMLIDDDNILESFIEIDKELNKTGVRPLDSYVVDDGWNNYNNTGVVDAERSGTTLNQSGFWEFNSKFPQGLTPSSELVHNFGSNFGVWIGPRGGYNFYGSLADILTKNGTGSKAGGSIDVADRVYVKKFEEMAIRWMEDYGVNYWKWDGFADNNQYGAWAAADGVPGYANHHMTGGYQNMYHVTDLWEGWIDLMEAVRQAEKDYNINKLWISLTCYVNPSPWYLQWANSVWIQCTADQADAGPSSSKMDRQMTYRDAMYYDFLKNHEFQFPLSNLYNHDPVYGTEGTGMNLNTATDEQFQNYLYMLSTRGTAFWELYFSDSIMTPGKYEVAAEFLSWAEENYHMLRNAKMFGLSPASGKKLGGGSDGETNAYGFACFDGNDGLISFRNSSNAAKSVTINFDRTIGVPENAGTLKYHMEHSHNLTAGTATTGTLTYGQQYTVTLQPDEVRILRFSKNGDTTAPKFAWASSDGGDGVTVKFNEKVTGGTFTVNGQAADVEASADDCTFHLTAAENALVDGQTVTVTASGVHDLAGNALTETTVSFTYHAENTVAAQERSAKVDGETELAASANSLTGSNGFTVHAEVSTLSTGAVVSQGSQYALGIREDGKAAFTVGGKTAVSKTAVNDGRLHMITGVKENNGMMKVYVDGTLEGSAYLGSEKHTVALAAINVGSGGFYGDVRAEVLDAALGYDEVAAKLRTETPDDPDTPTGEGNLALNKPITACWTENGADAAKGRDCPMSKTVDGTKNSSTSYGEFGTDNTDKSSYLQVDLEGVKSISGINLYRYWSDNRTYRGTVIELSETADFSGVVYQVYNSDADGTLHGRGLGSDQTYAETANGLHLTLTAPVNARYVRVYMRGTTSGGTTNHVVELEVLGR